MKWKKPFHKHSVVLRMYVETRHFLYIIKISCKILLLWLILCLGKTSIYFCLPYIWNLKFWYLVLKLNPIVSLHGDNSNHINPYQITSIKRHRGGNKTYLKQIIKETKTLIHIQDNVGQPDKAKVIANHEILSTKIQLIK